MLKLTGVTFSKKISLNRF